MDQVPQPKSNKPVLIAIGVVLALLLVCGGLVCGGATLGLWGAANSDKTYYPECENADASRCESCCEEKGHYGYSYGDILGEPGKSCGCL